MIKPEELEKIRKLLHKETGLLFDEKKNNYLTTRINARMQATQADTFCEYYHDLVFDQRKGELQKLTEAATINETYFFRDFPQLQGFSEKVLLAYAAAKRLEGSSVLKIWSAACSTGEEPYTLSIIAQEMLDHYSSWDVRIEATDIDCAVLQHAMRGVYGDRSVKDTPTIYLQRHFTEVQDGWKVRPHVGEAIVFRQLNFMDRSEMRKMRGYDFIFCRNVLIYFDDETRQRVVASLYDSLVPGGYLFLGHSESIGRITAAFELMNVDGFLCYRRPV